jgi:hypothetical protein
MPNQHRTSLRAGTRVFRAEALVRRLVLAVAVLDAFDAFFTLAHLAFLATISPGLLESRWRKAFLLWTKNRETVRKVGNSN